MGQTAWGWLIAIYLFLGGLGAGAFLVAAATEWSGIRYKHDFCPTTIVGAGVSGLVVAIGSALLILDLGAGKTQPWRILWMFTHFTSVMTWGIWILSIFIPLGILYGVVELLSQLPSWDAWVRKKLPWFKVDWRTVKKPLTIVGSVFAVATAVYTGVLISAVGPAIPFWSAPLFPGLPIPMLPVLFLVSAISTGMGLTIDLSATIAMPEVARRFHYLPIIHLVLIGLEALLIGLYLYSALGLGGAGAFAADLIIKGHFRTVFWAFVVFPGLFLPFIVHAYAIGAGRHAVIWGIISGVGIVIAGLFLRYIIISAGIPAFL